MATRPLQTITLTNEGGEDTTYTLSGTYPDLTAGAAEQIISDDYTENKVPYLLRASNFGSKREEDTLVGGTVAWNQLWNMTEKTAPAGVNTGTLGAVYNIAYVAGHKYFMRVYQGTTMASNTRNTLAYSDGTAHYQNSQANNHLQAGWHDWVFSASASSANGTAYVWAHTPNVDTTYNNFQLYDLTQMFGSTIADYIYSLEQATTGAGVAWFKALFPADYYAYNAGELMSVSGVSEHKMVGFNAWDEEWEVGSINGAGANASSTTEIRTKNYISVIPDTGYYMHCGVSATFNYKFYDVDKNYLSGSYISRNSTLTIPSGVRYMRFFMGSAYGTTYNHDICINLSSSRNGQYEPYKAMSYPLDDSLTLRGIPKLDGNNNLYYDGDTYESNGTVTRKYGIVDLGSLTYIKQSGSQSGNYTFLGSIPTIKPNSAVTNVMPVVCTKYVAVKPNDTYLGTTGVSVETSALGYIKIYDPAYNGSTADQFKTAMNGVYLVYELATSTTDSADPYTNPQTVDPDGTEEYVTTSIVPVGHETKYFADLVERLAAIPEPPTSNGTYRLIATVSGGVATLSWVAN